MVHTVMPVFILNVWVYQDSLHICIIILLYVLTCIFQLYNHANFNFICLLTCIFQLYHHANFNFICLEFIKIDCIFVSLAFFLLYVLTYCHCIFQLYIPRLVPFLFLFIIFHLYVSRSPPCSLLFVCARVCLCVGGGGIMFQDPFPNNLNIAFLRIS